MERFAVDAGVDRDIAVADQEIRVAVRIDIAEMADPAQQSLRFRSMDRVQDRGVRAGEDPHRSGVLGQGVLERRRDEEVLGPVAVHVSGPIGEPAEVAAVRGSVEDPQLGLVRAGEDPGRALLSYQAPAEARGDEEIVESILIEIARTADRRPESVLRLTDGTRVDPDDGPGPSGEDQRPAGADIADMQVRGRDDEIGRAVIVDISRGIQ